MAALTFAKFRMPVVFGFTPIELQMDWRVLVFTVALSFLTGILFGLLPALQATRPDLIPALKNESTLGGYRRSRLRNVLVVAQMSLSLVLLLCAGLVLRGLQRAEQIDPGFNPEQAVEVSFDLGPLLYDRERGREMQRQVLERVRSLPGLQAAALTSHAPLTSGEGGGKAVFIQGDEPKNANTSADSVDDRHQPGLFPQRWRRASCRAATSPRRTIAQSPPVAIVNEAFARRFWPGENPLGKQFNFTTGNGSKSSASRKTANTPAWLKNPSRLSTFRWRRTTRAKSRSLPRRGRSEPADGYSAQGVHGLDENLPLYDVRTMLEHMELPLAPARLAARAFGAFGALALLLAAVGVFGVMSNAVSQRTREIGIRIALGADSKEIFKLIVGQGALLVGTGVAIGLGVAGMATRLLASLLFGLSALDPSTFAGVTALLTATAFLACYLPARRAIKVDPMVALRQE
jgi:predicted permease